MSQRSTFLVPVLLLVVDACSPSAGCGPSSGCAAGATPGALGNGSFVYVCTDDADDSGCNFAMNGTGPLPGAMAVGANFTVEYDLSSSTSDLDPGSPESDTPSILADEGAALQFVSAGQAALVVPGKGGVVDFTQVFGEDIATFSIVVRENQAGCGSELAVPDAGGADAGDAGVGAADAGDAGAGGAGTGGAGTGGATGTGGQAGTGGAAAADGSVVLSAGTAAEVTCDPVDSSGIVLAGIVVVTAESSDPNVVSVGPSSLMEAHAIELCAFSPGTVTITVTGGGKSATFPVTVTSGP